MLYPPKTIDEARKMRYGTSALNEDKPYKPGYCAYSVSSSDAWHSWQCSRKNGKGPNGLYCGTHAKKVRP